MPTMTARTTAVALAFSLILAPLAAKAATAVAVLRVHNARCALCPLIVKSALKQTKGVETVAVGKPDSAGDMTANVVFDNAVTTAAVLAKVVTGHGYPTQVAQQMSAKAILKMKPMK
jgi:mercuric ion binding protein